MALRPRWKKVLRDMGQHKARTVLAVSAIALGLLSAGSVLNTYSILGKAVREGYLATNPPSATLRTREIDDALLASVAALPTVAAVEAESHAGGRVRLDGEWVPLQLFALQDFASHRIGLIKSEAGEWPPTDGHLLIEQSSVDFAESGMGDVLEVEAADGTRRLPITGVVRDSGLAPGWMEHVVYAFATAQTVNSLGLDGAFDRLEILVQDNRFDEDHIRRVAFEVKTLVESTGRPVFNVSVPTPGQHIHAGQMDSLLYVQGAFGVLALLCSGVLVVNLMTAILGGQVREIGVMKAVGARTRQIAGIYLVVTAAMGVAAAIVAIPLALWIGRAYAAFAARLLNFDVVGHWPDPAIVGLQLAAGALLPAAAALLPVSRGAGVTVSQAIRDYGIPGDAFSGAASRLLSRVSGPTRPLLLSLRNTFRRRSRLALTLLTMAAGGAVFVGALNLRTSIRQTVAAMFDGVHYDLRVSLTEPRPFSEIERVAGGVSGVEAAEAWLNSDGSVVYEDGLESDEFSLTGLPVSTQMAEYPLEEGRWLREGDSRAIVVNRRLARLEPRLQVGEKVTLAVNGDESEWTVTGIVRSSPVFPAAYTDREALAALLGQPSHGHRVMVETGGANPAQQSETLRRLESALEESGLPVRSVQTLRRTRAAMEDHFLMVANFLIVMALLILLVGGFGLATTMSLAVLERTREIGVMRAIGAAASAVHRIVVIESLCLGALSWLIAVPLSLPMSWLVGKGFGQIMFQGPIVTAISPWAFVVWLIAVLVLSGLAGLYPALNATRISTAEALAYG